MWYRNKKSTVEDCRVLDIGQLRKKGSLRTGSRYSWTWTYKRSGVQNSISIQVQAEALVLSYTVNPNEDPEKMEYRVPISWSDCNYGGQRPWLHCPACGKRVTKLHFKNKYFLCRSCHALSYYSRQQTPQFRLLDQVQKIREKLNGDPSTFAPFPTKPKGMHWKTYHAMMLRHVRLEACMWGVIGGRHKY